MSDKAKNRSIVAIQVLDGFRHQINLYLCKLMVSLLEMSNVMDDVALIDELTTACTRVSHSLFLARARIIKTFVSEFPDFNIKEAEEEGCRAEQQKPV